MNEEFTGGITMYGTKNINLTLNLLTTTIVAHPSNASKWQMGFNSAFKGLRVHYLLTYLFTYLLTPWSKVLLQKLAGSAASQEIRRIFGTRRFLTVLTSARHLSLS